MHKNNGQVQSGEAISACKSPINNANESNVLIQANRINGENCWIKIRSTKKENENIPAIPDEMNAIAHREEVEVGKWK